MCQLWMTMRMWAMMCCYGGEQMPTATVCARRYVEIWWIQASIPADAACIRFCLCRCRPRQDNVWFWRLGFVVTSRPFLAGSKPKHDTDKIHRANWKANCRKRNLKPLVQSCVTVCNSIVNVLAINMVEYAAFGCKPDPGASFHYQKIHLWIIVASWKVLLCASQPRTLCQSLLVQANKPNETYPQ